jgi:hypothetical protein
MTPIFMLGSSAVAAGFAIACGMTLMGCVVALPLAGAAAFGIYGFGKGYWKGLVGKNRRHIYHSLDE